MKSPGVLRGTVMGLPLLSRASCVRPMMSPIWVVKMVTAMPAVKPMTMG